MKFIESFKELFMEKAWKCHANVMQKSRRIRVNLMDYSGKKYFLPWYFSNASVGHVYTLDTGREGGQRAPPSLGLSWILGCIFKTSDLSIVDKSSQAVVAWLAGWPAGWLVGWLAGWLVGWLAGRVRSFGFDGGCLEQEADIDKEKGRRRRYVCLVLLQERLMLRSGC